MGVSDIRHRKFAPRDSLVPFWAASVLAQTAMEADVLNNQQHALAVETQHAVDAMQAIEKMEQSWADMFGTVPAAAMTGPQVYDPYSDKMVSAPTADFDMSPGGAAWGGYQMALPLCTTSNILPRFHLRG